MRPAADVERLLREARPMLYRAARQLARRVEHRLDETLVEELVSEGQVVVWQTIAQGRLHGDCWPYLRVAVRHAMRRYLQECWGPAQTGVDLDQRPDPHSTDAPAPGEWDELLAELTPRQRRVLELRFGLHGAGEHTTEEVGEELGLTPQAVRRVLARALERLRERCEGG